MPKHKKQKIGAEEAPEAEVEEAAELEGGSKAAS